MFSISWPGGYTYVCNDKEAVLFLAKWIFDNLNASCSITILGHTASNHFYFESFKSLEMWIN